MNTRNIDEKTVASFGDEWTRYDQGALNDRELEEIFTNTSIFFHGMHFPNKRKGSTWDVAAADGRG